MEVSDDYKLFLLGAFSALQNRSGKCIMNPNKSRHRLLSPLQRGCKPYVILTFFKKLGSREVYLYMHLA